MNFIDIILPVLAFVLLVLPVFFEIDSKALKGVLIFVGIVTLFFSLWKAHSDSNFQKELITRNDSLINLSNSLNVSVSNIKHSISELGLKIDEKTNNVLVIDSQLLKSYIIRITNNNPTFYLHTVPKSIPPSLDGQRHITDSLLNKIKKIPKGYPVSISYNPDKESSKLKDEVKSKLILLGYQIKAITTSLMWADREDNEIIVTIDNYYKTASIDIMQKGYYP